MSLMDRTTSDIVTGEREATPVITEAGGSTLILVSLSVQVDPNKEASKWVLPLRREARVTEDHQQLLHLERGRCNVSHGGELATL